MIAVHLAPVSVHFASLGVERFLAWLALVSLAGGALGFVLALVGLHFDQVYSRRARYVIGAVVALLIVALGGITFGVCAQDLTCACDVCQGLEAGSALWYLYLCFLS